MVNTQKLMFKHPIYFIACGFGSGALPKAPGTWGTLMALPFYYFMQSWTIVPYSLFLVATFLLGIYLCDQTTKAFGVPDHPSIVWDEMVGLWITLLLVPNGILWIVLGFLLFRIFDIAKPWPISLIDRHMKGGLGIMLDDVIAGVFAWIVIQLIATLV